MRYLLVLVFLAAPFMLWAAGDSEQATGEVKTVRLFLWNHPTEWTTRTAEHPVVIQAPKILAEEFMKENPNIKIEFQNIPNMKTGLEFSAWLKTQMLSGTAPELIRSWHNIPVQEGYALPLGKYLDEPNPFAPEYPRWRDIFYETFMTSLIWEDGEEYCAPIQAIFPALEVGLMYNKDWFSENNMMVPSNWTELKEVSKQLKDMGSGLSPWPKEADDGHFWALALQVLVPMMQGVAAEMDTNGDMFVGTDEALPAYRNGLIGPKTELYQRAFREVAALNENWIEGFSTIDLETMFKKGDNLFLQYNGAWGFSTYANDPAIDFEVGFLPAFIPLPEDIPPLNGQPGAFPPDEITKGDGKVPAKYVSAIQGADNVIMKDIVEKNDNEAETIRWLQFLTTPENSAFMINENQTHISAAKDAELGSIFKDIAKFKVPMYDYSISWWGMGLYWDAPSFVQWRKVFVSYMQGHIDWDEFIEQMEKEFKEGSDRFAETLSKE